MVLCFVNALMNLTAFEFGNMLLVKSMETGSLENMDHFQT